MQATSTRYEQMIAILDDIESLNAVPDKLEQQMAQKLFMSSYKTLSNAIVKANQEDITQIPALQGMKGYLQSQEVSLYSVLIEELHNHIYLKSPYTDSRWHSYRQGIDDFATFEQVLENKIRFEFSEKTSSETSQLDAFLKDFHKNKPFVEITSENAESDSFYYIRLLIETLENLNRLPNAFEAVMQRLPAELHKMVDKTITEVGQRFPKNLNTQTSKSPFALYEVGLHAGDNRLAALKDLTWTLCSKFIAILQAHRVIYEVSRKLWDGQGKTGTYDFAGIYQVIETEINTLLSSYITLGQSMTAAAKAKPEIATPFDRNRYSFERIPRKKQAPLFKFSNLDTDQDDIKQEYKQLQTAFEKTVPGLVASSRETTHDDKFDPYLPVDLKVAHQLLVSPNVFNIRVMLEPVVQFIQKASVIFPANVPKPQVSFVENFMVNTFVPQLENTLVEVYITTLATGGVSRVSSILTETSINWAKVSKMPVLDDIVSFYDYLRRTCYLLNTSAIYREHYVNLVIRVIERFGRSCATSFESKVTYQTSSATDDSKLVVKRKLGASWVGDPSLRKVLSNTDYQDASSAAIIVSPGNAITATVNGQKLSPYQQEVSLYLSKRASQKTRQVSPITQRDLLSFTAFQSIATLATSIRWLVLKLKQLKRTIEKEDGATVAAGGLGDFSTALRKEWLLIELIRPVDDAAVQAGNSSSLYTSSNGSALSLSSAASNGGSNDGDVAAAAAAAATGRSATGLAAGNMDSVALTLSGTAVAQFDKAVAQLERLAETCVLTLKADMRCRALHYMDLTMLRGDFYLANSTASTEPQDKSDEYIAQLDADLTRLDGIAVETLVPTDRAALVGGLAKFFDLLVVASADGIQYLDDGGVKKLYRHIVVLQQMLKSIDESPKNVDFSKSQAFFKYMELTPAAVLDQVKRRGSAGAGPGPASMFGYDQIKTLLRLIRSKNLKRFELAGKREAVLAEKTAHNEDLVKLHDYYWGTEKVNVGA